MESQLASSLLTISRHRFISAHISDKLSRLSPWWNVNSCPVWTRSINDSQFVLHALILRRSTSFASDDWSLRTKSYNCRLAKIDHSLSLERVEPGDNAESKRSFHRRMTLDQAHHHVDQQTEIIKKNMRAWSIHRERHVHTYLSLAVKHAREHRLRSEQNDFTGRSSSSNHCWINDLLSSAGSRAFCLRLSLLWLIEAQRQNTKRKRFSCHANRVVKKIRPTYDDRYRRREFPRDRLLVAWCPRCTWDRWWSWRRTPRSPAHCTWRLPSKSWSPPTSLRDSTARRVTIDFRACSLPCRCNGRCTVPPVDDRSVPRRLGWRCRWCERRGHRAEPDLDRVSM